MPKGLFIWEAGWDGCRDGTFAGTFFIPALKTVYMEAERDVLPGRDIFYPGFKKLFIWEAGRDVCREGMFHPRFTSQVYMFLPGRFHPGQFSKSA